MATPKHEPFTDMQKNTLDSAMQLAQMSLENAQTLAQLQADTAREIFDESLRALRAMSEAKDTRSAMETRNEWVQSSGERLLAATRRFVELTQNAQAEMSRTMSQQLSIASAEWIDLANRMMQSLPMPATESMNVFQSMLESSRSALEQIAKASQEAFSSFTSLTTRAAGAATKTATAIVEPFTPRVAAVEAAEPTPAVASAGKRSKHE